MKSENRSTVSSVGATHSVNAPVSDSPSENKIKKHSGDFIKSTDIVRIKSGVDRPMLIIVIMLLCFGTVMVFSASHAYALSRYGDSMYYIRRQLIFGAIGLAGMLAVMSIIDYRLIRVLAVPYYIGIAVLLVAVLVYGEAKGEAVRWIEIAGIRFQPSEFMKPGVVFVVAAYMAKYQNKIRNYKNFWQATKYGVFMPMVPVAVACILVALEKHFSGTIILFLIGMLVIFIGGAMIRWFAAAGGAVVGVLIIAILFTDYAKERLSTWLNPEAADVMDEMWQTVQGLNAVGSGGFLGVGLGNSRQKHLFVSEPQNDFIFSIICEELGFVGAFALITLFVLFVWRGIVIALKAPDTFSSLVVAGLVGKVAIQSALNLMVVTGMLPNTGISLPFISYGGTALVVQLVEMGVVLAISRYSYQDK